MAKCVECGATVDQPFCTSCFEPVEEFDFSSYKPVTWQEVTSHLKSRLMMDVEWVHEAEDSLDWWPWFLPQRFSVSECFEFDYDGYPDIALRVKFMTNLGRVTSESTSFELAAALNRRLQVGSFVIIDGHLFAVGAVGFNSRNRSLLNLLHTNALIQTTISHEIALELEADGRIELPRIPHPVSGHRLDKDDLLTFFESEPYIGRDRGLVESMREAVQIIMINRYISTGATKGFEADDVRFVNLPQFDLGIGWQDDTPHGERFGPGIDCVSTLMVLREPLSNELLNDMNLILHDGFGNGIGHLGAISGLMTQDFFSVRLSTFFAHSFLSQKGNGVYDSIVTATNAIAQTVASTRMMADAIADWMSAE